MTDQTPRQGDIPLTEMRLTRGLSDKTQSASSPSDKLKDLDVHLLSTVFPKLIRWRLLVFYAPFYRGTEFESSVLDPKSATNPGDEQPNVGRRLKQAISQSASEYASHKARQQANAILDSLKHETTNIDLVALNTTYVSEKQSYPRRSKFPWSKFTPRSPTLEAIITVSERLDIPLSQFELALDMYTRYVEQLHQNMLTTTPRPKPAYHGLGAHHLAAHKQWDDLARTVHEDMKDISAFSIFPRPERDGKDKGDEMWTFHVAARQCSEYYFADLELEQKRCCRGSGSHGVPEGYRMRRGVGEHGDGHNEAENGSGTPSATATSCIFSTFWSTVCARLPHRVLGMHVGSGCGCKGGKVVRYRLSPREEALMDGSLELMNGLLRGPSRPDTQPVELAARSRGKARADGAGKVDAIGSLPAVDELQEGSGFESEGARVIRCDV